MSIEWVTVAAADAQTTAARVWLVLVVAGVVAAVALFVAGVVSVLRSPRVTPTGRAVWIVAILVFPLLGPLVWFWLGRRGSAEIYR